MIYRNGIAILDMLTATTTKAILAGNVTAVGSLASCSSNGTTTITKAAHGLTLANGELVHITSCTTAADKGFYRIASSTGGTIVVDRALSGTDADVALTVYKDVLCVQATDATNGQFIGNFSAQNKPLQIGGHTYVSTTDLTSEDVVFGGEVKFVTNVYIGDSANAKSTLGLTINQAGNDDEILTLKSSDVGHSFTTDTETDTFFYGKKLSATLGGAGFWGLSDGDATGLQLTGGIGIADPTNTIPAVVINGVKLNGTTYGALGNPETVFQVQNNATPLMTTLGSGSTSFINSVFATPIITKGPAAVAAGFVGTITATASTTVTFSSAADAILAGYDATNPVLGVTLISNALTRYIVSWTNATTAVVDTAVTWAGTAITSIQFPISVFVNSAGVAKGWMLASGVVYWVENQGVGTPSPLGPLHISGSTSAISIIESTNNGVNANLEFRSKTAAGVAQTWRIGPNLVLDISDFELYDYSGTAGTRLLVQKTTGNVGINITTFGTSLAGGLAMGVGTAATGTITGAQLWAANFNGASSARFHTMTQEGQSAALATVNETAIYYGVTWDESADTYTRTGRTSGHKTGATLPASMLPVQRMMERVLLNDDGTVNYVLSPTDSTLKIDGSTASTLTGADGQVMVRIPKFWYRYSYTGTTHTWEISPVAMSGFDPHPAFYKDGAWVDYRYIGAYEASLYDVSISAYVDGIYQTAVSAVFDTTDDSITIASRSNWATNLTVGQKLVITGTVSNNATLTVASLVSGTKITVSENLTDETAAATVIETQKDYTATTGDKLASVSGKAAINYLTRANARVIAANRGAGWRQIDFDLISAIQMLYLTEYASFYSQSMIGSGITNVAAWDVYNDYNPIARSGNSNSIGNATGNTGGSTSAATESTKYLSYRGIENWFGHLWKWVDGFNINDNIPYVTNNATNWADDTAVNYTRLVNVLGANITLHNADGYSATIQKTGKGFLAASVGASSSTKVTDYYYQAAAWRVAFFGGASNYGAYAGGFSWALDYASGALFRNIGGRLSF